MAEKFIGGTPGSTIGTPAGAPTDDDIARLLMAKGINPAAAAAAIKGGQGTFNAAIGQRVRSPLGALGKAMLGFGGLAEQSAAQSKLDEQTARDQQLKLAQYRQGRADKETSYQRALEAEKRKQQYAIELATHKAQAEGQNPSFGKTGTIGYDSQGNPVAIQFSSSGQVRKTPLSSIPMYGGGPGAAPSAAPQQNVPMSAAPAGPQRTAELGAGRFAPPTMTDASPILTPNELANPGLAVQDAQAAGPQRSFTRPQDIATADTEDALITYNKVTGQEIRRIPKNLGSKKRAEKSVEYQAKLREGHPKAKMGLRSFASERKNVNTAIQDAIKIIKRNPNAVGLIGSTLANVPGTDAYQLAAALTTVGAGTAFGALKDMKASSPTGGALGQVTERELDLLQNSVSAIQQGQQPKTLVRNLTRVKQNFDRTQQRLTQAYKEQYKGMAAPPEPSAGPAAPLGGGDFEGWTIRKK